MVWDFAEPNIFARAAGDFEVSLSNLCKALIMTPVTGTGVAYQGDITADAAHADLAEDLRLLISTDPPYYGNVGYSDLSDFFYIWLRRTAGRIYPNLFGTVLTPKAQEVVATPFRFDGDRVKAEQYFLTSLGKAFRKMRNTGHPDYPLTVYYAFKQTEDDEGEDDDTIEAGVVSTGWEKMLSGLLAADFQIVGTWPMRTELTNRMVGASANALASSIILVCRPRLVDAPTTTRREFIAGLKRELPLALKELQKGYIAPVDLAQAVIGPGMAVFSRFSQVLDTDGLPMRVRAALALINQTLDEFLSEQEGEFDSDTRWALSWFEQFGHNEGPFGDAETLSKAKNTSIDGLVRAGILEARAGKVRLLGRDELDPDWRPERDDRRAVWEATQYLIRALDQGGEQAAADLLRRLGSLGETARDLAYRLYSICERKGWAQEALAYNMLAAAWPRLSELAGRSEPKQDALI
jgi:putative DNA methylase